MENSNKKVMRPHVVMRKLLDCSLEVSKFELQSSY